MLYDKFFKPAAEWTGKKIIDGLNGIADALDKIGDWIRDNNWFVEGLSAILIGIAGALALVKIGTIAMNASLWAMSGGLISVIAKTWAWTAALLVNPWTWVVAGIAALIAAIVLCVKHWDELKEGTINCFRKIAEVLDKVAPGWRSALNVVIWVFEWFVNKIIDGINLLTSALNKVGFDIPDFLGGGHFGINIGQVSHVSIPRLAKGAVLEAVSNKYCETKAKLRYSEIKSVGARIEIECTRCKSKEIKKNGKRLGKQRYMCKECRKLFLVQNLNTVKKQKRKQFSCI